jgi:hypothetical protein
LPPSGKSRRSAMPSEDAMPRLKWSVREPQFKKRKEDRNSSDA